MMRKKAANPLLQTIHKAELRPSVPGSAKDTDTTVLASTKKQDLHKSIISGSGD